MITDELLGKGGFGAVYLCDFNGRNAAAKVRTLCIVPDKLQAILSSRV